MPSDTPTTEAGPLIDAYARLLEARHDHAHNGDIVRLGPVDECEICVGGMRDFIGHVEEAKAEAVRSFAERVREWRLIHGVDVDFDAGEVRCNCGNFAGTTTFMEHLVAALLQAETPDASDSVEGGTADTLDHDGHLYVHVAACPCPEMQAEVERLAILDDEAWASREPRP